MNYFVFVAIAHRWYYLLEIIARGILRQLRIIIWLGPGLVYRICHWNFQFLCEKTPNRAIEISSLRFAYLSIGHYEIEQFSAVDVFHDHKHICLSFDHFVPI